MPQPPSQVTKTLNLVISLLFSVIAVAFLMPAGLNLVGVFQTHGNDRLRCLTWALACLLVAADVLWLGWRVVPRAFIPQAVASARGVAARILVGVGVFVGAFVLAAVLNSTLWPAP